MSTSDMIRLCTFAGTAIVAGMLLLGAMMIAQKPEARLELAKSPEYDRPMALPTQVQPVSAQPEHALSESRANASI